MKTVEEIAAEVGIKCGHEPKGGSLSLYVPKHYLERFAALVRSQTLADAALNAPAGGVTAMTKAASELIGAQPAAEPVPEGVLTAIRRVGLTLLKTKDGYELRKFGQIEALKSQPTADFMAEVRATCAAALATPGKAVPVSADVQAEMHKFMRGEPSVFDQMTVAEFQSLAAPQAQPSPEVKS